MPTHPLIAALEAGAQKHPERLGDLAPPATQDAIDDFKKTIGLELPASFDALYRWHDGQPPLSDGFVFDMELLSLEGILDAKKGLDEIEAEGAFNKWNRGQWWNPAWVPFLDDRSSRTVVIDTVGSFGGKPGQILTFRNDSPTRTVLFPSFDEWLQAAASILAQGIEPDDEAKALLMMKGSGYPKEFEVSPA